MRNAQPAGRVPVVVGATPDQRARADEEAFRRYVLPELEVLLRVAMSRTRSVADAEDLVQETLLRAYRSIDSFDGSYPRAWLLTILRNAHVNSGRRRRPSLLRDPEAGHRLAENQDPLPSVETIVVGELFDAHVADAMAALPARFRQVVELVDIDGLAYREAADALGVPIGTVMSRLHRARRRIRTRLTAAGLAPRSPR